MIRAGLLLSALALMLPGSAPLAQSAPVQPSGTGLTPAEMRAKELIAAINGPPDALEQFVAANWSRQSEGPNTLRQLRWSKFVAGDAPVIEEFRNVSATRATAVTRNPITGRWYPFIVEVEAEAPYRIVSVQNAPAAMPPGSYRPNPPATQKARFAQLDGYAKRLTAAGRFSGVILVAEGDKILFEKAYGLADRSFRVPNDPETRLNVGSIDKVFTTLAAFQLIEQGKLSLEDPLGKFIDFPDSESAQKIKIKHLLSHTSGIGDYISPAFFEVRHTLAGMDDYMKLVDRLKPAKLAFEPGKGWTYSNLGMLLVGRIIEKVTGEDYYDHIQRNVFDKAGMTGATDLRLNEITPNVATLYDFNVTDRGIVPVNATFGLPLRSAPDGGSVAGARDLMKLAQALRAGKIVRPETFAAMSQMRKELGAERYGYGIMDMSRRLGAAGRDIVGHGGDVDGGCATFAMIRDAEAPYTLVVLANSFLGSCFPVSQVAAEMIPPRK